VLELQGGEERAEYGKQVIENLSKELTSRYGEGFSVTTLQYFRKFYQVYSSRSPNSRPLGAEFCSPDSLSGIPRPTGVELAQDFNPHLSWSHYRALMRVDKPEARLSMKKKR
jgi:hypothetical protein